MLSEELRKEYNPDNSMLRKAQLRMVEMLRFVDDICKKNNIIYWLDAGTLLGAVRHGGFIPWDDDTDICMPLADMLKFKKIMLESNPSEEFILQCHETDPGYNRSQWVVLRDLKSEYIQDNKFHQNLKYKGLQIDIFPLEKDVPTKLKKIVDILQMYFIDRPTVSDKWYYKIVKPFRKQTWAVINKLIIPQFRKYKVKSDYYYMSYGIPYYYKRYFKDIYPLKRMSFENYDFNVPFDVDSFLTSLYGDWKTIPKQEDRHTHEVQVKFY